MKILILTNHLNLGGVSVYARKLAERLVKENKAAVFMASRGGDLAERLPQGIKHIRVPLTTKCEVSPKVFLSALMLKKIILSEKIDVIHANTRVTQVLGSLLSIMTHRPLVTTCHGYFKRRLGRVMLPCWGRKVIAISDQVRDHLIYDFRLEPDRIELVYNGVEADKFVKRNPEEIRRQKQSWGFGADSRIIGHIGRLSSVKGQKYMIAAAAALKEKRPELRWVVVGEGQEKKELEKTIASFGLGEIVHICPSIPDTSLALAAMDIFVMPSIQEGLGISILEAQAQGVAVVASRTGGIPTVIEDRFNGLLVAPRDPAAIASAVEVYLDRPEWKAEVEKKAAARVRERFSLDLMARKTYEVYTSL